jgi:hypothetical protein
MIASLQYVEGSKNSVSIYSCWFPWLPLWVSGKLCFEDCIFTEKGELAMVMELEARTERACLFPLTMAFAVDIYWEMRVAVAC